MLQKTCVDVCVRMHSLHVLWAPVFSAEHTKNANQSKFQQRPTAALLPRMFLTSDIVLYMCVNFKKFKDFVNAPVYFHLSLTLQTERREL